MGMYSHSILEAIRLRPGIRQIEIADLVDCDPEMVEPSIREELASGFVVRTEVTAPNGCKQPSYTMADMCAAPETNLPPPTKVAVESQPLATAVVHEKSKSSIAIEFIESAIVDVTDEDLRRVMGLTVRQYPSTFLGWAIERGKIHRDGRIWRPGKAPQPKADAREPVASTTTNKTESNQSKGTEMANEQEKSTVLPAAEAGAQAVDSPRADFGKFTCALWSDGELQLARNGRVTETLTAEEVQSLRKYLEHTAAIAA